MLLVKSGWIAEIPGLRDSAEAEAVAERHRAALQDTAGFHSDHSVLSLYL